MELCLELARGPLFRFALLFMVLGLGRHLVLTFLAIRRAIAKAGDKDVPLRRIALATLGWLFPFTKMRPRRIYSFLSIAFHAGIIITPLFLAGHIALWQRGLGFGWPAIGNSLADVLTLVVMVSVVGLVVGRQWTGEARSLTRSQDIILLLLVALPFASGFILAHPALSPFDASAAMLVHALSADLVMVLIPTTKLSHCVLLPTTQLVSDVGWRFPPDAGEKVLAALRLKNQEGT